MGTRRRWTEGEIAVLEGYYEAASRLDLMEKLVGRSWIAICLRAQKIGLSRNSSFKYGHGGWPKGMPKSDEWKRKTSISCRNHPKVREGHWKGKHHSEESNLKTSETMKKRWRESPELFAHDRTGDKNPNWRGGTAPYTWEFMKIRKQIKIRDNYACQKCGVKEEDCYDYLDVHHIDTDKENNDPSNLVTLCPRCHGLEHRNINKLSVV